ncbi:MAG: hypothetical protein DMF50_08625 [Acidobacteria bacterium]|nr:MAG: hypothetical protein DMF50_08625 [Acidobacteriota bacterium]
MPEQATLERRIGGLFLSRLHLEVPSADTDLFDTGILDSMGFVELLATLEEEFCIRVPLDDVDMGTFRSLARIAEFVARRMRAEETACG